MEMRFEKSLRGVYDTSVKGYTVVENDKGGYCQVIFRVNNREYKVNIFPSNLSYWGNNLARVAKLDSDDLEEILNHLITNGIIFPLEYGIVTFSADGRRFSNGVRFINNDEANADSEEIGGIEVL